MRRSVWCDFDQLDSEFGTEVVRHVVFFILVGVHDFLDAVGGSELNATPTGKERGGEELALLRAEITKGVGLRMDHAGAAFIAV